MPKAAKRKTNVTKRISDNRSDSDCTIYEDVPQLECVVLQEKKPSEADRPIVLAELSRQIADRLLPIQIFVNSLHDEVTTAWYCKKGDLPMMKEGYQLTLVKGSLGMFDIMPDLVDTCHNHFLKELGSLDSLTFDTTCGRWLSGAKENLSDAQTFSSREEKYGDEEDKLEPSSSVLSSPMSTESMRSCGKSKVNKPKDMDESLEDKKNENALIIAEEIQKLLKRHGHKIGKEMTNLLHERLVDGLDKFWHSAKVPSLPLEEFMTNALANQMTNSKARDAISCFLKAVCMVALGEKFEKNHFAFVYQVGTSAAQTEEGFPILQYPHCVHQNTTPRYVISDKATTSELTDQELTFQGPSRRHAMPLESGTTSGSGHLFPDLIVASGHKPNWPRILLITDIKSTRLKPSDHNQLVTKMLGPLANQTEVFGLIIDHQDMYLYRMRHNLKFRRIEYDHERFPVISPGKSYSNLLTKLVSILSYAKENVKEIAHVLPEVHMD